MKLTCGMIKKLREIPLQVFPLNTIKIIIIMNRTEAKDLLPIIQAFAEGKTVEFKMDLHSLMVLLSV